MKFDNDWFGDFLVILVLQYRPFLVLLTRSRANNQALSDLLVLDLFGFDDNLDGFRW